MSFAAGRPLKAKLRIGCALAVAVVLLVAAAPIASFCCLPNAPCCPMGMAANPSSETAVGSATPDCCRPTVGDGTQAASERLVPRPVAPDLATLPIATTIVSGLTQAGGAPIQATDLQSDPPSQPRQSRAPPLS
jgi:hypothetical protein